MVRKNQNKQKTQASKSASQDHGDPAVSLRRTGPGTRAGLGLALLLSPHRLHRLVTDVRKTLPSLPVGPLTIRRADTPRPPHPLGAPVRGHPCGVHTAPSRVLLLHPLAGGHPEQKASGSTSLFSPVGSQPGERRGRRRGGPGLGSLRPLTPHRRVLGMKGSVQPRGKPPDPAALPHHARLQWGVRLPVCPYRVGAGPPHPLLHALSNLLVRSPGCWCRVQQGQLSARPCLLPSGSRQPAPGRWSGP